METLAGERAPTERLPLPCAATSRRYAAPTRSARKSAGSSRRSPFPTTKKASAASTSPRTRPRARRELPGALRRRGEGGHKDPNVYKYYNVRRTAAQVAALKKVADYPARQRARRSRTSSTSTAPGRRSC